MNRGVRRFRLCCYLQPRRGDRPGPKASPTFTGALQPRARGSTSADTRRPCFDVRQPRTRGDRPSAHSNRASSTSLCPARPRWRSPRRASVRRLPAARCRWRADGPRLPRAGGRKTGRGSTADPLGVRPRGIATEGLGVSWATWAVWAAGQGQRLPEAVRAFPDVVGYIVG